MIPTAHRRAVLVLLLAAFAFRLLFVAHDLRDLVMRGPLYDDSFYSFQVARNIAQGHGSTFDGVEPTNGYQPLYVLLLVPVYWLSGGDASLPIYAALVGSALVNILTGLVLWRLLRPHVSPAAGFFALVLWGFGPAIVRQSVNGLETSLAMFLIAVSLEYYLHVYRPRPHPSGRQAATLGLLLGLAIFARIDAALFAVALGLDAVRRGGRGALGRLLPVGVAAAAVLSPWCVGSQLLVGTPVPESGAATRFLSEAYAPHDHPELAASSFAGGPPAAFLLENLSLSFLQLGTAPALQPYTRALERLLVGAQVDPIASLYAIAALLVLVALALVFVARRARVGAPWLVRDFGFLFLYAGLLVAAYSFVVFGQIFYSRYYYPIFFVSVLLGAFACEVLLRLVPGRRRRRVAAGVLLALYGVALPFMCLHRVQNGNYRFLHVVDWIAANTPPGATIGAFNSGAIGYFSDRRVVNLDGKVNRAAFAALRQGRLGDYVRARRIDYVIDHDWILGRFLLVDGQALPCVRVAGPAELGVPNWSAYRIEHPAPPLPTAAALASRLHP